MSSVNTAYTSAGLKGIMDLYTLFPERMRETVVRQHAELFRSLWKELIPSEREIVEEYRLDGDVKSRPIPESIYYERKLQSLEANHGTLRATRIQEASSYEPEVATALLMTFETAHTTLTKITQDLLTQSRDKEREVDQREREAVMFEPSETQGLCTISLR